MVQVMVYRSRQGPCWAHLGLGPSMESLVCPSHAKAGNGRRPVGLSIMLRTYFVQQ